MAARRVGPQHWMNVQPRRSPFTRAASVLVLLLHLGVAGVAQLVETRADASPVTAGAHLTAAGEDECHPAHDHVECQLCRTLRAGALPVDAARHMASGAPLVAEAAGAPLHAYARASARTLRSPRAPPSV